MYGHISHPAKPVQSDFPMSVEVGKKKNPCQKPISSQQ